MTQPGDTLGDRWTLVEKIDAGAMGEVFRAEHRMLGHAVAVKVLRPEMTRDPGAIERFLREARIAAKLRHPNVVRVEDYGLAQDGRPYLVMELLHGESLARRLARTPRLHPRVVLAIVSQIGEALDAAHAAGIVHRDLKPENIFLCGPADPPKLKVLDFGVAKFTDSLAAGGSATASNTLVGTPRYMSPEQARASRTLDGRSDLWALGILAYEMLTGRHPFDGEAIAELLVAILTHPIVAPSGLRPSLPVDVDAWCTRALARNRAERFANGRALADALASALGASVEESWSDASAPAPTAPRGDRGTVRVRRHHPDPTPNVEVPPVATLEVGSPDETPHHGLAAIPTSRGTRWAASWWAAIPIALAAAFGLIVVSRLAASPGTSTVRRQQAAFLRAAPPGPPPQALPPLAAPIPEPPPAVAPVPPALQPQVAGPAARDVERARHDRRRRHRPRGVPSAGDHRTSTSPTLYDPDGI